MGFRVDRLKFGLTYSCPVDTEDNPIKNSEDLQQELESLLGLGQWIVAEELHESGKRHYHVYYKADVKFQSTNVSIFDVAGVHPNVLKPGNGWIGYCVKDKKYITNFYEMSPYREILKKRTWDEASDYLWEKVPRDMALNGARIKINWEAKCKPVREARVYYGPYRKFPEWDEDKFSLLLTGAPGMGKTQHTRAYCKENGGYFYVKGRLDRLKHYDGSPYIIFDDIVVPDSWKQVDCNALVDVENGGELPFRYGNADLPGGVKRIFLTNGQLVIPDTGYGDVERRIKRVCY